MKKVFTFLTIAMGFVFLTALTFHTPNNQGLKNAVFSASTSGIPDTIMKVFQNSCMDCHCDDASGFAKGKVNFDKWGSYSPEKQAAKAKDICEEVTKNSMPPKGFRKNFPDRVPSDGDVKLICSWANTFQK